MQGLAFGLFCSPAISEASLLLLQLRKRFARRGLEYWREKSLVTLTMVKNDDMSTLGGAEGKQIMIKSQKYYPNVIT